MLRRDWLLSREQFWLFGCITLMVLMGLPAFILPDNLNYSNTDTGEDVKSLSFSTLSIPNTSLDLEKTTKRERKRIKQRRKVNLNEADSATLRTLPDVGSSRAQAILEYRKQGHVFRNHEDLKKVKGIGKQRSSKLRKYVKYGEEYYEKPVSTEEIKINVNTASESRLKKLPGIGTVIAERIVNYRKHHGEFETYSDLDKVNGIGSATVKTLADEITGISGEPSPEESGVSSRRGNVNINFADKNELETLPGVGPVTAEAIIQYRKEHGNFSSVEKLENVKGIGETTLKDIRPRATVP